MAARTETKDTNFTVFIRLPFPRGDFVDPPPVSIPGTHAAPVDCLVLIPSGGMEHSQRQGTMGHPLPAFQGRHRLYVSLKLAADKLASVSFFLLLLIANIS